MTRKLLAAALALLAAACGRVPEDMTAHYSKTGGQPFAVEAAANGDSRIVAGDEIHLRLGGTDYIVMQDAAGSFVARAEDLFALLAEPGEPPRPQPDYVASETGPESVAGIAGKHWKVHPKETPSIVSIDAVISGDPALATVGKGLAAYTRALITRNSRAMGAPGNLEKAMIALGERGTVLRFGTILNLERIDRAPIPAERFRLPSNPLDKDSLRRRLTEQATPSGGA